MGEHFIIRQSPTEIELSQKLSRWILNHEHSR
uniref:Uncharacterized protein n=1 Tax=Siphoviridae sp. ctzpQ31 TaxID=2823613 RepID=A0A8S5L8A3_9CAUD|nr:MAG TPA: hypothetical protein [Siphoviridae sp. ctzpQ31]DAY03696.1 MAG TPA: hypothetical protein [Bacteriophage sp.]